MNFAAALSAIESGKRVTRASWDGVDAFVEYLPPFQSVPPLYLLRTPGASQPWNPQQSDMFATDWVTLVEPADLAPLPPSDADPTPASTADAPADASTAPVPSPAPPTEVASADVPPPVVPGQITPPAQ